MKKDYTHIAIVLDRSGSMSSVKEATINGFNEFIVGQRQVKGEATVTLAQFDDVYEVVYDFVDLKTVPFLNERTYCPRNFTALLDAMGRTINETGKRLAAMPESQRPERVIMLIQTDGMENSSKEFDSGKILEMVTHQRDKYNWQFIFLGANQDAILTAQSYGIQVGKAITYAHSALGTEYVYSGACCLASGLRICNLADMSNLTFSTDARKAQEEELIK